MCPSALIADHADCALLLAAVNIQQLARQREERLGVVEYELRVAQEDLAEHKVLLIWHVIFASM